jgi:hypothetical protein
MILQPAENRMLVERYFHSPQWASAAAKSNIFCFFNNFKTNDMKNVCALLIAVAFGTGLLNAQTWAEDDIVSDFENLPLEANSWWNGSDMTGGFQSGLASFPNTYDPDWQSWSFWAFSNMADDSTAGWMNQYSAITAAGYDTVASGGTNYAVAFVPTDFGTMEMLAVPVSFTDSMPHLVRGLYVTNTTYAALAMEFGDDFSKKFGGESGDDPDYFKLIIRGYLDGIETEPVEFFLADYRFSNNDNDYIVKSWEWVELSGLGKVDSLLFMLGSSDTGLFGMNTPAYFCIDNLHVVPANAGLAGIVSGAPALSVYPNPASALFRLDAPEIAVAGLGLYNLAGERVFYDENYRPGSNIDIGKLPAGAYIIKIYHGHGLSVQKLIIR